MNKRTWWKAAAALVVGGVGIAAADSPKVEQAIWTRAAAPLPASTPAPPPVVPAAASVPAVKPQSLPAPLTIAQPNYPLPPKASSDEVVLPKFRPALQPVPASPATTLPQISMPPVSAPTTSAKVPVVVQPPIPPAVVEEPKPLVLPATKPEPLIPVLPPPPLTKLPEPAKPVLPPIPELAPPAQPAKSADAVKPVPPAVPDFNLRPVPGGNSVKTDDAASPMIPIIPPTQPSSTSVSRPKPVDGPMAPTEKYVFPIPATIAKPVPPATLPKLPEMPEVPAVPARALPGMMPPNMIPVPMVLPGVPTAIERPQPPKPIFTTIPTPGADPMIFKQATLAAAIGGALALAPATPAFSADPVPKTVDEKLDAATKEIKRLGELLDGRKDTDGTPSPVDVGAVKEIKKLKDDVFALKTRVADLENQLAELKKTTTSQKPVQQDPMAGKGVVRIENEYPVEITIVVNSMSYRVPANTKLDVTVAAGDFTYQLLNSGANLAPTKSPIKEKEIVRLRIK